MSVQNLANDPTFLIDQSEKPRFSWVKGNWKQFCIWPLQSYTPTKLTSLLRYNSNIPFNHLRYILRRVQRDGRMRYEIFLPPEPATAYFESIRHLIPHGKAREHIPIRRRSPPRLLGASIAPTPFNALSWNCCGINESSKQTFLKNMLSENQISIFHLQETLSPDLSRNPLKNLHGWTVFHRDVQPGPHTRGIATGIKHTSPHLAGWDIKELACKKLHDTSIFIKLSPPFGSKCPSIVVANLYLASQSDMKKKNHNRLSSELFRIFAENLESEFLIMGDFNCPADQMIDKLEPFYQRVRFCPILGANQITFMSHNRNIKSSTIDHTFASNRLETTVKRLDDTISDHFPIIATSTSGSPPQFHVKRMVPSKVIRHIKSIRSSNYFSPIEHISNADEAVKSFEKAVHSCASDLNLWSTPSTKPRRILSESSKSILRKRKKAAMEFQRQKSEENAIALRTINGQLRKSLRTDSMINGINSMIEDTEPILSSGHVVDSWKSTLRNFNVGKACSRGSSQRRINILDSTNPNNPLDTSMEAQSSIWKSFYQSAFGSTSISSHPQSDHEWNKRLNDCEALKEIDRKHDPQNTSRSYRSATPPVSRFKLSQLNAPILWREIAHHIRRLGERKTPGEDAIISEIFKTEIMNTEDPYDFDAPDPSSDMGRAIFNIITLIWKEEKVPESLKSSIICPIPKIPNASFAGDYRPISLIPVSIKLLTSILAARILRTFNSEISREQAGFRSKEECIGQIVTLHDIIRWSQSKGLDTFLCFIDLQQAFDSVPHFPLMKAISDFGIKGTMFNLIKNMYSSSKCKVRLNDGQFSDDIPIARGVKQGDPLSPILFVIFMDTYSKLISERKLGISLNENVNIGDLMYADDVALATNNQSKLQYMLDITSYWLDKNCMKANPKKCGILTIKSSPQASAPNPQKFFIQQQEICEVEKYKYLGIDFDSTLSYETMALTRIQKANKVLISCKPKLLSNRFPLRTKILIVKSIIIPTLTYGCALWGTDIKAKQMADGVISVAMSAVFGQKNIIPATIIASGVKTMREIYNDAMISLFIRSNDKVTWLPEVIQLTKDTIKTVNGSVSWSSWSYSLKEQCKTIIHSDVKLKSPTIPKPEITQRINTELELLFPFDLSLPTSYDLENLQLLNEQQHTINNIDTTKNSQIFRTTIIDTNKTLSENIESFDKAINQLKRFINDNYLLTAGAKHVIAIITGSFWQGARNYKTANPKKSPDVAPEDRKGCIHCKSHHVETISHMIRDCPAWSRQRKLIWNRYILSPTHADKILRTLHRKSLIIDNEANINTPISTGPILNHEMTSYEKIIQNISMAKCTLTKVACFLQLIHPRRANQRKQSMYEQNPTLPSTSKMPKDLAGTRKISSYFAKSTLHESRGGDQPVHRPI